MSKSSSAKVAPRVIDLLMIEDDVDYRHLVERWLGGSESPRFGVRFASRLDDTWHRIDRSDLILLDLGLPDAAGMDTLVAARELAGNVPIVVLTALDDEALGQQALRAGADAFIPKRRAGPQTLREALCAALDARPKPGARCDANAAGACATER